MSNKRTTRPLVFYRPDGEGGVEQLVSFPGDTDLADVVRKMPPLMAPEIGRQLIAYAVEAIRTKGPVMWEGLGK